MFLPLARTIPLLERTRPASMTDIRLIRARFARGFSFVTDDDRFIPARETLSSPNLRLIAILFFLLVSRKPIIEWKIKGKKRRTEEIRGNVATMRISLLNSVTDHRGWIV